MAGRFFGSSAASIAMIVTNTPSQELALTNLAYISASDLPKFAVPGHSNLYLASIGDVFVFSLSAHESIRGGHIALNSIQRRCAKVSAAESVDVTRFVPPENFNLAMLTVELDFVKRVGSRSEQIDALVLAKQLRRRLNNQVMTAGQKVLFEFQGNNYSFTVREATVEGRGKSNSIERGIILEDTFFVFDAPRDSGIKIINQREGTTSNIFKLNVYLRGRTMEGSQGFRYWLTCDSEIYETYEEIVRFQQKSSEALEDDPTSSLLIPCILGDEIYSAMKKIIGLVSSLYIHK